MDTTWEYSDCPVNEVRNFITFEDDGRMYVLGQAGGPNCETITYCSYTTDGLTFQPIVSSPLIGTKQYIAKYKDEYYLGGSFPNKNNGVYKIVGDSLVSVGDSLCYGDYSNHGGTVYKLIPFNDQLFVIGTFNYADKEPARGVAIWNGENWNSMPGQLYPNNNSLLYDSTEYVLVWDAIFYRNTLYVAGNFNLKNPVTGDYYANEIAFWNGQKWQSPGNGVYGDSWIENMVVYKDELYIGGYFNSLAGNAGSFIQKWNGEIWTDVGGAFYAGDHLPNGQIHDMKVYNGELYVSGLLGTVNGKLMKYIAKWDGTNWTKIAPDFFTKRVSAIGFFNEYLYVYGGYYDFPNDTLEYPGKGFYRKYIGKDNSTENNNISIFPNPFSDQITLQYNLDKTSNFKFALYDALGNIVYQEENPTAYGYYHYLIPTQNLAQGLYIARIELNGKTFAKKVLKQ
jgi:hypothetical protein